MKISRSKMLSIFGGLVACCGVIWSEFGEHNHVKAIECVAIASAAFGLSGVASATHEIKAAVVVPPLTFKAK